MYRISKFFFSSVLMQILSVEIISSLINSFQFLITQAIMVYLAILCLTTNASYDVTLKAFLLGAFMEVTYTILWFQFYYVSYIANGGKKYKDHQKAVKANKSQWKLKGKLPFDFRLTTFFATINVTQKCVHLIARQVIARIISLVNFCRLKPQS